MKLTKESCNQSKESCSQRRPMKMLVVLLWVSILLEVISTSFGCFDVREYYGQGRCAYIVSSTCLVLMAIWLAMAIARRKNWARKSYIVAAVLLIAPWTMGVCFSYEDYASDNSLIVGVIDAIDNAVILICCCLLFTKKVRVAFGQDVGLEGPKTIANVYHCLLYWFVYVMIGVGVVVQMRVHDGSEAYVSDCTKAAEQGLAEAQYSLGLCYANGEGVAQDKAEAAKWYRKAAEQGDAEAQCSLGVCYSVGDGVAQDRAEAVKWYRKAVEQGLAEAQNNLGVCYANGEGVAQSKAEAVKWFYMAAEHGYASAQYNLGICYDKGDGVAQDKAEAVRWLRKAAEQGYQPAKEKLDALQK